MARLYNPGAPGDNEAASAAPTRPRAPTGHAMHLPSTMARPPAGHGAPTRTAPVGLRSLLAAFAIFLALGPGAIGWINLGFELGVDNYAALAVIAIAPFAMRKGARPPLAIILLLVTLLYLAAALSVRGETDLLFLFRPIVYVAAGLALSMLTYPRAMGAIVMAGFLVLVATFLVSAVSAGVDLYADVIRNLATFQRRRFVYSVVRATLNAFTEEGREFAASQLNTLSAFLTLAFAYFAVQGRMILAALAAFLVLVLFSSSAMLTLLVLGIMLATGSIRSRSGLVRFLLVTALAGVVLAVYFEPIAGYIANNIETDAVSRSSRVGQYAYALEQVNQNPFFGNGLTRTQVGYIHNIVLFAWSNSGLIPMLLLIVTYGLILGLLVRSIIAFYTQDRQWLVVTCLLLIFVLRTMVGGGGGLPGTVAGFALGLAYLEAARLSGRIAVVSPRRSRRA